MRFQLIDQILQYEAGKSLSASKFLALGEEYLADHFPRFPVMPGVMMLQALVEAGAWLWRQTSNYQHPVIVLREVRNIKYGNLMHPGHRLDLKVDWVKAEGDRVTFRGKGINDAGDQTVNAQFVLHGYCLADRGPAGVARDEQLIQHWKELWSLLKGELRAR